MTELTHSRCQCRECGEIFSRTSNFDRHRTGKHGVDRRCMSQEEMINYGLVKNESGIWVYPDARPSRKLARYESTR